MVLLCAASQHFEVRDILGRTVTLRHSDVDDVIDLIASEAVPPPPESDDDEPANETAAVKASPAPAVPVVTAPPPAAPSVPMLAGKLTCIRSWPRVHVLAFPSHLSLCFQLNRVRTEWLVAFN